LLILFAQEAQYINSNPYLFDIESKRLCSFFRREEVDDFLEDKFDEIACKALDTDNFPLFPVEPTFN
jgi:hypothetical protein